MLNLRTVIAQVLRKPRSIGSRRNFCTSPPEFGADVKRLRLYGWILSRFIGIGLGIGIARYIVGDEARYRVGDEFRAGYNEQLHKQVPKVKGRGKLLEDESTSRNTHQESLLQEETETMKTQIQFLMDCNKLLLDKFPDLRPQVSPSKRNSFS